MRWSACWGQLQWRSRGSPATIWYVERDARKPPGLPRCADHAPPPVGPLLRDEGEVAARGSCAPTSVPLRGAVSRADVYQLWDLEAKRKPFNVVLAEEDIVSMTALDGPSSPLPSSPGRSELGRVRHVPRALGGVQLNDRQAPERAQRAEGPLGPTAVAILTENLAPNAAALVGCAQHPRMVACLVVRAPARPPGAGGCLSSFGLAMRPACRGSEASWAPMGARLFPGLTEAQKAWLQALVRAARDRRCCSWREGSGCCRRDTSAARSSLWSRGPRRALYAGGRRSASRAGARSAPRSCFSSSLPGAYLPPGWMKRMEPVLSRRKLTLVKCRSCPGRNEPPLLERAPVGVDADERVAEPLHVGLHLRGIERLRILVVVHVPTMRRPRAR